MKKIWVFMIFTSMVILVGCLRLNPTHDEVYKSIQIPKEANTNISIPQTYNHDAVTLVWTSNNHLVLSTLGVIDRQEEDVLVILTVEINIKGIKQSFDFEITVLKKEINNQEIVDKLIDEIVIAKETKVHLNLPLKDDSTNAVYTWQSSDTSVLTNEGKVITPLENKDITLSVLVSLGQADSSKTFVIKILNTLEHEDIFESISFPDKITKDLNLFDLTDYKDVIVSWTSSEPSVITDEGVVKRSKVDVEVTLTLKIEINGAEKQRQYQVIVEASQGADTKGMVYYQSVEGLESAELIQGLNRLLNNYTKVSYGDARYVLEKSDLYTNAQGETYVRGMYDHDKIATHWIATGAGAWQREHVWPQSKLGDSASNSARNIASDLHNLRAISGNNSGGTGINQVRSNRYFVDGSGVAKTVGTSAFYPGDEDKGDVARILFYMVIMYPRFTLSSNAGQITNDALYTMGSLDVLLKWHKEDPVDEFEINRNNYIYSGERTPQRNRNPFIDLPDLVDLVFGTDTTIESWNLNQAIAMLGATINHVTYYEIKRTYQQI